MKQTTRTLTYKQSMSKDEMFHVVKAVAIPVAVFALAMFAVSNYGEFGTRLLCPFIGAMWLVGVVVGALMPSQRKEVLNQTMTLIAIYCFSMLGLKLVMGVVSGVSSEMIAASYDQAIPTATGNTFTGFIQTMTWFVAVLTPIADIIMQVRRLLQFKKTKSLHQTFGRERGLRGANKEHMSTH